MVLVLLDSTIFRAMIVQNPFDLDAALFIVRTDFVVYLLYILVMSLAFFLGVNNNTRAAYETSTDYFRAFCEVGTFVLTLVYLVLEVDRMFK